MTPRGMKAADLEAFAKSNGGAVGKSVGQLLAAATAQLPPQGKLCNSIGRQPKLLAEGHVGYSVIVPLVTRVENNQRHWRGRLKRTKAADKAWITVAAKYQLPKLPAPLVVTMTRLAPQLCDDGDGVTAALKNLRDSIAEWHGRDDGDREAWTWDCDHQKKAGGYGVLVTVMRRDI
jgi:hypothetical protein